MSFESTTEFARWTLSFVATQIRRRRFDCRAQPGPALAVSNVIESLERRERSEHPSYPRSLTFISDRGARNG